MLIGEPMNIQISSNNNVVNDSKRKITIINGIEYPWRKEMTGNSCTIINSKVYIDGFELKNDKWKRTIKALWYKWF